MFELTLGFLIAEAEPIGAVAAPWAQLCTQRRFLDSTRVKSPPSSDSVIGVAGLDSPESEGGGRPDVDARWMLMLDNV